MAFTVHPARNPEITNVKKVHYETRRAGCINFPLVLVNHSADWVEDHVIGMVYLAQADDTEDMVQPVIPLPAPLLARVDVPEDYNGQKEGQCVGHHQQQLPTRPPLSCTAMVELELPLVRVIGRNSSVRLCALLYVCGNGQVEWFVLTFEGSYQVLPEGDVTHVTNFGVERWLEKVELADVGSQLGTLA